MINFFKKLLIFILVSLSAAVYASTDNEISQAELYKQNGNSYYTTGKFHKAIDEYSKAILLAPDYSAAFFNRGLSYYNLKLYFKAIVDFDKVISLDPDDPATYFSRGLAYEKAGKFRLAMEDMSLAANMGDEDAVRVIKSGRIQKQLRKTVNDKGKLDFGVQSTIITYKQGDIEYEGAEGIYQKKVVYNEDEKKIKTIILHTAKFNTLNGINKTIIFYNDTGGIEKKEFYLTGKKLGSKEVQIFDKNGNPKKKVFVNIFQ